MASNTPDWCFRNSAKSKPNQAVQQLLTMAWIDNKFQLQTGYEYEVHFRHLSSQQNTFQYFICLHIIYA